MGKRDAWLREACGPDTDLHHKVASLLANHHDSTSAEGLLGSSARHSLGKLLKTIQEREQPVSWPTASWTAATWRRFGERFFLHGDVAAK